MVLRWSIGLLSKYLQSQCNGIEDKNNIKLLSTYIKKLQNTTEVEIFANNEIAL